jgi:hypothetical protein
MTQLAPNRLNLAEFSRNHFVIFPEANTPFSKVLEDKYWAHTSAMLKRGDRVEVRPDDDAYFAEVLVLDAGKLYAKVQEINYREFYGNLKDAKTEAGEFHIEWRGPAKRWCGFCGTDELAERMTKDAAVSWLEQRRKKAA